jgi:hypothetical protein
MQRDLTLSAHWLVVDRASGMRSGLHLHPSAAGLANPDADGQLVVV